MPKTCENWLGLVKRCIYYALQTHKIYQVLPYSVDFKAPGELWNQLSKTVLSKCSSISNTCKHLKWPWSSKVTWSSDLYIFFLIVYIAGMCAQGTHTMLRSDWITSLRMNMSWLTQPLCQLKGSHVNVKSTNEPSQYWREHPVGWKQCMLCLLFGTTRGAKPDMENVSYTVMDFAFWT